MASSGCKLADLAAASKTTLAPGELRYIQLRNTQDSRGISYTGYSFSVHAVNNPAVLRRVQFAFGVALNVEAAKLCLQQLYASVDVALTQLPDACDSTQVPFL
jgi:hypothetical protein